MFVSVQTFFFSFLEVSVQYNVKDVTSCHFDKCGLVAALICPCQLTPGQSQRTLLVFFFYMIEGPPALILYEFNQGQIIMPLSISVWCLLKCFYCYYFYFLAVLRKDELINFFYNIP